MGYRDSLVTTTLWHRGIDQPLEQHGIVGELSSWITTEEMNSSAARALLYSGVAQWLNTMVGRE